MAGIEGDGGPYGVLGTGAPFTWQWEDGTNQVSDEIWQS
jgi:hypothetical protein